METSGTENESTMFETKSFNQIFILYSDGRKYGPGTLTLYETEVGWTEDDGQESNHSWNTRFEDVNLHAIGSDDSDEGYVLVQVGEQCEEIRLIRLQHDEIVTAMYNAFCDGVVRCPAPGDDENDDDMYAGRPGNVLDHLDSLITDVIPSDVNDSGDDGDGDERYADADDDDCVRNVTGTTLSGDVNGHAIEHQVNNEET